MPPGPTPAPPSSGRLAALDLFRGATVAGMVFVNNPGDWGHVARPFGHAEWHGWTPTDLVFPFFLFVVGTSGVLSLGKRAASGATRADLLRHVLVRGGTIVLIGWLMAWYPFGWERLARLRIPGVLPRIGVVYALGTALVLLLGERRRAPKVALAAAGLVALHTALLSWPGFDLTREGNVARAVDLALLEGHLWKKDWDPEGIVSTLPSIATMLTGTLAGLVLRAPLPLRRRIALLAAAGAAGIGAGLVWAQTLPVNKNLWTGSYVVLSSGFAAAGLAVCLWGLDVRGWRSGTGFFVTFGKNPLLAFVLSGFLAKTLGLVKVTAASGKAVSLHQAIYRHGLGWIGDPYVASHAFALATVGLWYAAMRVCEKRGWYWKV